MSANLEFHNVVAAELSPIQTLGSGTQNRYLEVVTQHGSVAKNRFRVYFFAHPKSGEALTFIPSESDDWEAGDYRRREEVTGLGVNVHKVQEISVRELRSCKTLHVLHTEPNSTDVSELEISLYGKDGQTVAIGNPEYASEDWQAELAAREADREAAVDH